MTARDSADASSREEERAAARKTACRIMFSE